MLLAVIQSCLVLIIALAWACYRRSAKAFIYGVIIGIFSVSLGVIGYVLVKPGGDMFDILGPKSAVCYIVLVLVIGALLIALASSKTSLGGTALRWFNVVILALVGAILCGFSTFAFFASRWAVMMFADIKADQLLFFAMAGNPEGSPDITNSFFRGVIIPVAAAFIVGFLLPLLLSGWHALGAVRSANLRKLRRITVATIAVVAVASIGFSFFELPLLGAARAYFVRSNFVENNYVNPVDKILHFPAKPKNFIHIYLESMENSYYANKDGGYMNIDLMPDLGKLTRENTSFSDRAGFGGPQQTTGANHSVAGMMNMQAGVPMLPLFNATVGGRISYADFPTLGDILRRHGYQTSFMLGSDSKWYGLKDYYLDHGNFQIFDLQTAKDRGYIPQDYLVWWGVEDDKLYEYAKIEMTELAKGDKPFYFILENADTHAPDGYQSPLMKEFPSDKQYGNVIHYSQHETVKLVRWIQQQPWYKDTLILLTGDHRSHGKTFFEGWDPNYDRTVVNVFINGALPDPGCDLTHNRQYAPFDFFPTILASLGVQIEGDRLGLGTNLYSGKPTLVERYGVDYVNEELRKRNPFYEQRREKQIKHRLR